MFSGFRFAQDFQLEDSKLIKPFLTENCLNSTLVGGSEPLKQRWKRKAVALCSKTIFCLLENNFLLKMRMLRPQAACLVTLRAKFFPEWLKKHFCWWRQRFWYDMKENTNKLSLERIKVSFSHYAVRSVVPCQFKHVLLGIVQLQLFSNNCFLNFYPGTSSWTTI